MDAETLKPYLDQTRDIQPLKEYFDQYNRELQEFGLQEADIDTSNGLVGIVKSIDGLQYNRRNDGGITGHWNGRAYDSRHQFCKAVLRFFGETGEVPTYSAKHITKAAEKMTLGHVANSFYNFAKELTEKLNPQPTKSTK